MRKVKAIVSLILLIVMCVPLIQAQNPKPGFVTISLNDLGLFRRAEKGWKIGSALNGDLYSSSVINLAKGTGILVSLPQESENPNLQTMVETGDLELDLDFMLSKGADARVYLQGRYGIQLSDSWAVPASRLANCGGITERWDEGRPGMNKGYEGMAPLMNVCRAPGLWQHLSIVFRSPHINASGQKVGNASFEEVYLNGVLIHSRVQVSGPARNAPFTDEKLVGPLVLQKGQGVVAFRNISYRLIHPLEVRLDKIKYRYYKGALKSQSSSTSNQSSNQSFPDLSKFTIASQDTLSQLTWNTGKGDELFAIDIEAEIHIPTQDNYTFSLLTYGLGRVYIDDKMLIERITNRWNHSYRKEQVNLSPGAHKLRLVYVKNVAEVKGALALSIQGLNTDKKDLQDKSSTPIAEFTDPVVINPQSKPYLLRSFLNYGSMKLTHAISVGDATHTNYSYDMKQGALIQVWRGEFLDVTDMWVQRGEPQLAMPLGSLVSLSDAPSLAVLPDAGAPWPDSIAYDDMQIKGYTLDSLRYPAFNYLLRGASVTDKISTAELGKSLLREVKVTNAPAKLFLRVTAAKKISIVSEGFYRIDDKSYYIRIDKRAKPFIRQTSKGNELMVPVVNDAPISYYFTW
ncbi:MAG: family 16 glycoside hydrolase [Chitinophagaceae bacterium]